MRIINSTEMVLGPTDKIQDKQAWREIIII